MIDYIPNAKFPTKSEYGIPTLDINMQAQYCDMPFWGWGTTRRSVKMAGTWHFYVDDYRFENIWKHPERVLETGCRSIVEPNFSVYQQTPAALSIWQVYRKRWLTRFWQSKGVLAFADLNVHPTFAQINMHGIPDGWTAFCTRGYTDYWKDTLRQHKLAGEIAGDSAGKLLFVVYGGGKVYERLTGDHGMVWIPEQEDIKGKDRETDYGHI